MNRNKRYFMEKKVDFYSIIIIIGIISLIFYFIIFNIPFLIYSILNLGFVALFHLLLAKPFYHLRGKKDKETISEHFILIILSFLVLWFIYGFFTQPFEIENVIYLILISISFTYLISASYFILNNKNNIIVDIGGYILALLISGLLISFNSILIVNLIIIITIIVLFEFLIYGIIIRKII